MTNPAQTILWHDYETWGIHPSVDFPVQFAAIRTTLDLEPVDEQPKMNWLCKIPLDYLPNPKACLITGITPQYSLSKGLSEPEFARRIHRQMEQAGTCTAGYNSIRFDEEVSRHLLFRNFYPVYEREYKNGNSKWDVIDLVRACYALRPQGIQWAYYSDNKPSFKLEELAKANNLEHEAAHDALSDVRATIAIAKLIKTQHPKLYNYYWELRSKHNVNTMLQQFRQNIFVYISGFISSEQGCCTLIMPVCTHPTNSNGIICIDLLKPIEKFEGNDAHAIQDVLFTKSKNETQQNERPGLFSISVNKCPFIAPIKTLSDERANTLNIDVSLAIKHFKALVQLPFLSELCQQIMLPSEPTNTPDNVDERLYLSEFPSPADVTKMRNLREALPEQLAAYTDSFESPELNKLLVRYRARNYPQFLDEHEIHLWQQHLIQRFTSNRKKACLSLTEYYLCIDELSAGYQNHPEKLNLLRVLRTYAQQISGG